MTHNEKLLWLLNWCKEHGATLSLNGTCGFCRPCVGILIEDLYPDWEWYDEETWDRIDENGDVWVPPDAYHKHPCVAVLGHGEGSESQLYEWLKWFEDNNFTIETGDLENHMDPLVSLLMGKNRYARMVRRD